MASERREPAVPLPGNITPGGGRRDDEPRAPSAASAEPRTEPRDGPREGARDPKRPAAGPSPVAPPSAAAADVVPARAGRSVWPGIVAGLAIGILLGVFGLLLVQKAGGEGDPFAGALKTGRYQAVILTNGKVYFGKIQKGSGDFYQLKNAFFLNETKTSATDATPQRTLLPVNREIQAPDNEMLVRRSEVVLVENLASDSPVQKEIERQIGTNKKG